MSRNSLTSKTTIIAYALDCKKKIEIRIGKATAMNKIWKSRGISLKTKLSVFETCVFICMLYGCEMWVITKGLKTKIFTFGQKGFTNQMNR